MPPRKNDENDRPDPSAPSVINDENDAEDPRTFEDSAAQAVREGVLSAAQLPGGHGNVDPSNPDAQYPPGVVQNAARRVLSVGVARAMVPERKLPLGEPVDSVRTTAATPDYGTNADE